MKSIILSTAIRLLVPLFQLFSIYILFRGHNHPGGGFIGGLIGSIGFIFYAMAHGPKHALHTFFNIRLLIADKTRHPIQSDFYDYSLDKEALGEKSTSSDRQEEKDRTFLVEPIHLIATGLLLAASSGLAGIFLGTPYMSALWADFYLPILGRPGTPILFDLGVYLLVMGVVIKITFIMSED